MSEPSEFVRLAKLEEAILGSLIAAADGLAAKIREELFDLSDVAWLPENLERNAGALLKVNQHLTCTLELFDKHWPFAKGDSNDRD
jgi:hypothetical protein